MNNKILSPLSRVLFTVFCIHFMNAAVQADALSEAPKRFALFAGSSYRYPLLDTQKDWEPYAGGGLWLEMPTQFKRLSLRMGLEAGVLSSKPLHGFEMLIFHGMAGLGYDIPLFNSLVGVRPFAGISNTTIYLRERFELVNVDVFSSSENEFGFFAGIEPSLTIGRLQIALPLYGEYVFSSPIPFVTATASACAGVIF